MKTHEWTHPEAGKCIVVIYLDYPLEALGELNSDDYGYVGWAGHDPAADEIARLAGEVERLRAGLKRADEWFKGKLFEGNEEMRVAADVHHALHSNTSPSTMSSAEEGKAEG